MPRAPSHRPAMIATSIRTAIAPVLKLCPPECGIVSITKIDVSSDLSYATLYVSALKEPQLALAFLQDRVQELRKNLSPLGLRRVPLVRFRLEQGGTNRLDELLR
ncbi:ribosome-binding factor A [Candidatus Peregrinibacteria bacterium]|nr:ribosome-binding factor A [Candidatus Peregrinibacteria bacterium]